MTSEQTNSRQRCCRTLRLLNVKHVNVCFESSSTTPVNPVKVQYLALLCNYCKQLTPELTHDSMYIIPGRNLHIHALLCVNLLCKGRQSKYIRGILPQKFYLQQIKKSTFLTDYHQRHWSFWFCKAFINVIDTG